MKGSRWKAELSSCLVEEVGRERARLGKRSRVGRIMVAMGCDAKVTLGCSNTALK